MGIEGCLSQLHACSIFALRLLGTESVLLGMSKRTEEQVYMGGRRQCSSCLQRKHFVVNEFKRNVLQQFSWPPFSAASAKEQLKAGRKADLVGNGDTVEKG